MAVKNIVIYVLLLSCIALVNADTATATRYNSYNNNYYQQQQMMRQQQMQQQQMRQQQEQMRRQQEQMRRQQEQMRQQQLRQQQQMRQRQQEMQRQMQARQQQAQLQRKQMQQRQQKMQQQRQKKNKQGNQQAKKQNLAKQQQAAQQRQALKQQKQLRERQQRLKKLQKDRLSKQNADKKKRDAQALTMASLMTTQRTKLMSSTSLSSGVVRQGQNLALNSKERSQLSSQIKERLDAARNNAKKLSNNKIKAKDEKKAREAHKKPLLQLPFVRIGHPTAWNKMSKKERRAFQHSYTRHRKELGLPDWKEGQAEELRKKFNTVVEHIRKNGARTISKARGPDGKKVEVFYYTTHLHGKKYYYYETLSGRFISAGLDGGGKTK